MFNQNFFNQANKVLPTIPKPIMPIFFIKIILTYVIFQILKSYIKFLNILKLLGVRHKFCQPELHYRDGQFDFENQ
jgi:hypothetical protein